MEEMMSCTANRQLTPFQHIEWALQQIHPHASLQAVLEPKFDVVAKLVAKKNPVELYGIGVDRLKFWAQRAVIVLSRFRVRLKP